MDLLPDEAQQEIADATRAFLADAMPIARLRSGGAAAARPDAALFARIAELGWFGLGIPETQGGVGCTLAEETLLFREVGRCAGAVQLLATAIAARVAAAGGAPEHAQALLAGRLRVGWAEPLGPVDLGAAVSGRFQVFDGGDAQLWLAVDPSGAALVDASSAAGAQTRDCIDEFTELAHADLAAVAAVARAGSEVFERAAVLAAAIGVGIAEAARDQAAAYAASRIQFGKPIGVFQAIKHRCADMAVRCEAGWSQTCYAALALRDGEPDAAFQVSAAKHIAGEAAGENAAANVQIHGGYGFTTEYDAHVLVKRAQVLSALAGAPRWHLRRVLDAPATS